MRINVISRHAARNYGSVLQALATRMVLSRSQINDVKFIDYRQPGHEDSGFAYASRTNLPLGHLGRTGYALVRHNSIKRIRNTFESFIQAELQLTDATYHSIDELRQSTEFPHEDAFCVGSDQVWNIETNKDNSPYYLDFAPSSSLKFSLASSVGTDVLPSSEITHFINSVSRFDAISVRERQAKAYLQSVGVPSTVLVDPVLSLTPDFWRNFAGPKTSAPPYILVYQLNGSSSVEPLVREASSKLRIRVRRIEYWRTPRSFQNPAVILPDVHEFVRLFRDAAFVVTDSFHGTAYSVLFGKPFVVAPPRKYPSRILSLLALVDQEYRANPDLPFTSYLTLDNIEADRINSILKIERERVQSFLGAALQGSRPIMD